MSHVIGCLGQRERAATSRTEHLALRTSSARTPGAPGNVQTGAPLGRLHGKPRFASFPAVRAHGPDEVSPWHRAEGTGLRPDGDTVAGPGPGLRRGCGHG